MGVTGQTVVITGASAGIGRATAVAYGKRGARVALLARGEGGLSGAAEEVEEAGGRALPIALDVANPDDVDEAATRVEREFGDIDVWVNNAFNTVFSPFMQTRPEEFRRVIEVTYLGYVHGTRAALRRMLPRNRGVIVQVGSALAYRGIPLQSAYCAAKHAIQGMHESLLCELLHDGSKVRTTMVQLPAINTPQFDWVLSRLPRRAQPVPPIYQPELAAKAILYAAEHPEKREHWLGGRLTLTLLINAIAPGVLDRKLARDGYAAQQTEEPKDAEQPVNLWRPADDDTDFGAHGSFDDRAKRHSPQQWLSHHRGLAGAAVSAVATAAAAGALVRRRGR